MDYQSYEDYMRQVLGYSPYNPNIYENYNYELNGQYNDTYFRNDNNLEDINELYPKIYHLIQPMVIKICSANNRPITRELLEKMTDEIYNVVEGADTVVNVRVETKKEDTNSQNPLNYRRTEIRQNERTPRLDESRNERDIRNQTETRKNNNTLRDLIKILILKQLLSENREPSRPPRPNYLPYPGGPGGMPPRPPYPRDI